MFIKFSNETQRILKKAKIEMQKLRHSFIGSEHVVLSILNNSNSFLPKLLDYGINYQLFYNEIVKRVGIGDSNNNYLIYTPLLKRVLENTIIMVKEKGKENIEIEDIFLSILEEGEGVANRILNSLGINIDNLYADLSVTYSKKSARKLFINEWGIDLVSKARKEKKLLIGRDYEVSKIIEILLRKNKNNPLLVGQAGVGKTAIVEEIAKRISEGKVPNKLLNYKIISISTSQLVAGTKYRGEFEERVNKILKELEENSNIIVFIDEIHTLIGAGGAEGAIDASNILKPALARGKIKLIGATTLSEYKEHISKDKAFSRRFQTILIEENTISEVREILYRIKPLYEKFHHVLISNDVLDMIVDLSNRYIHDKNNPDKTIDVLDMVCTKVSLFKNKNEEKMDKLKQELNNIKLEKKLLIANHNFNKAYAFRDNELRLENSINELNLGSKSYKRRVQIKDVLEVIETVSRVPIYNKNCKTLIKKIEKELHKQIIGQDNVIDKLIKVTAKIFCGLKQELPYSILLTGSSGVGKTSLVKVYSKSLGVPLIRLDMSEYNEPHTISKIIGSPPGYVGYNNHYSFLDKVRNNPFSIILLDELEKACSEVINLFLQILDEGIITDSQGEKVYFQNTIIFMTSNISNYQSIGFTKKDDNNIDIRKELSTIFVNRINLVLPFNKLTDDNIWAILLKREKEIQEKYRELGHHLSLDKNIIKDIIDKCESDVYGVRHAIKMFDDKVDDYVFDTIISQKKRVMLK